MLTKSLIYVTGLPHAGSTLLCQLLGQHPQVDSSGCTSPLCQMFVGLQQDLSKNSSWRSQLDCPQLDYNRAKIQRQLLSAFQGLINGWFAEAQQNWVTDKNGAWLQHLELLQLLDPNFRLLVCLRELGQVWGSIEAQHRSNLISDLPDSLTQLKPFERADRLFAADGMIGQVIRSLEAVQDRDAELQSHLYYIVYEHLVSDPKDAMQGIYEWLGLPVEGTVVDINSYIEQTRSTINSHPPHPVSPRITASLHHNFRWFYEMFYPGLLEA